MRRLHEQLENALKREVLLITHNISFVRLRKLEDKEVIAILEADKRSREEPAEAAQ